jgi:hypothetical protein
MIATVPVARSRKSRCSRTRFPRVRAGPPAPALNIVTNSGTNDVRGEGLFMTAPGAWQAKTFGTDGFCAPSGGELLHAGDARRVNPADVRTS